MTEEKTFWLVGFSGEAQGGYFIRNDLFKFFDKLKSQGLDPVGIKYDGTWNLEIIIKTNDDEK